MNETPDPVTNLGPDSGGRSPGQGSVKYYSWEWGPDESRRPGLPWIAIFLVVFGVLLLIQQAFPDGRTAGSAFVLALGIAFLIKWAIDRGTGSLYAGAIISALAAPGVLNAAGVDVDGLGTFCFGIAFLFIGSVRSFSGGGIGWQMWFGGLLTLIGGVNMMSPDIGGLILPMLIIGLGAALLIGSLSRRR